MYYLAVAIVFLLLFGLFYKIIMPTNEPSFRLMGILSDENLMLSVMNLAGESKNTKGRGKGLSLTVIKRKIKRAYQQIGQKAQAGMECFDFEYWIYDNYYKMNEVMLRQKKHMLAYTNLPHVGDLPRLYTLLQFVVKSTGGSYTKTLLRQVIDSYNAVAPLSFSEINCVKPLLEYALLEYIAIFASKSIVINKKIGRGKQDCARQKIDLTNLNFNSYCYGIEKFGSAKLKHSFHIICQNNGLGFQSRLDNFYRQISAYTGQIQSSISNLHKNVEIDDAFIISLSPLYTLLMDEKDLDFSLNTLATQFIYLYHIAARAQRKHMSELAYARQMVDQAVFQKRDLSALILPVHQSKLSMAFYIAALLGLTVGLVIAVSLTCLRAVWWAGILAFPIAFAVILFFSHQFFHYAAKRRYLPRKTLLKADFLQCKTMILFSRLIASADEVDDAFAQLETIAYANHEHLFSYGILIDLPAADQAEFSDSEHALIARCEEKYNSLGEKARFNVFIRKRKLIEGGKRYQGWEKKRGALLDLNQLILHDDQAAFHAIFGAAYNVKYIIALDSDTLLNCGLELVQIMEHPGNQDKHVVSIAIQTNPSSANKTPFARLMSGAVGLDNYSGYVADTNFDLFGSGNYTGKGIYRVKEFHEKVGDMFRDNRILSHDFIEGAVSGCGNAPERALDTFPSDFSSFIVRQQRWIRGDWQLLPYLKRKIRNRYNEKIKNPLSLIAKWHILCNIISSLVPVSALVLLLLSLFFPAKLALVLVAFSTYILYVLNSFRVSTLKNIKSGYTELFRQIFLVCCLPVVAVFTCYSVTITILRLVRGKKLLEWKVFAHSKGQVSFFPNILVAAGMVAAAFVLRLSATYYVLAAVFLAGLVLDKILSKQHLEEQEVTQEFAAALIGIAKKTWTYFSENLSDPAVLLPADNYQEYLGIGYAQRTSPTNIGMALVSIVAAIRLEIITAEEGERYTDKILTSVERAPKWHGNLYNWMDTHSLEPLEPKYVSSVDSGNFLASLILCCMQFQGDIKRRAQAIIDGTDIGRLFDEKRGLLVIGYNDTVKTFDRNHYDLLGSESALTYLVAIGLGKIDKSSWNNLSRQCVKYKGTMLYSWTGGMFEYVMSAIFYSFPKRGLMERSAKNVTASNVRYAKRYSLPFFGISECQYNAIDNNGLYQYKAFGLPDICLSNSKDTHVIAPYAAMLSMEFGRKFAAKNLQNIIAANMIGKYGLYESMDEGNIIKSYMAHHQGMIMGSIANLLDRHVIRGMMQESPVIRASELLITQQSIANRSKRKVKRPALLRRQELAVTEIRHKHRLPQLNLLSNGKYCLLIDEFGKGYAAIDGILLSRYDRHNKGMQLIVDCDGASHHIMQGLHASFSSFSASYQFLQEKFSAKTTVYVLPNQNGEVREVTIKNLTDSKLTISFRSYMEICLSRYEDYIAHRAYANLFVSSAYSKKEDMILIKRTNKNMPILAHYFDCTDVRYETNRSNYYRRGKQGPSFGHVLDPVVSGEISKELKAYEEITIRVFTLVSYEEAYLKRISKITRSQGYLARIKGACYSIGKSIGVDPETRLVASKLLFDFQPVDPALSEWHINTRIPLIVLEVPGYHAIDRLLARLESLKKLFKFGIHFNLAIVYRESYSYFRPLKDALQNMLDENGFRRFLSSQSTLHLFNAETDKAVVQLLTESATNITLIDNSCMVKGFIPPAGNPFMNTQMPELAYKIPLGIGGFLPDDSYAVDLSETDTPAPWSNIIANASFGTLITESGGGYTFWRNARENKVTAWCNDAAADTPSEFIILQENNLLWSITKQPIRTASNYYAVHGFGCTTFYNNYNGFFCEEAQYISKETKFYDIKIENKQNFERKLYAMLHCDAVLGDFVHNTYPHLQMEQSDNRLIMKNQSNHMCVYIGSNYKIDSYSFYNESIYDITSNIISASNLKNEGIDKNPSYSIAVTVPANGSVRVIFSMGMEPEVDYDCCDRYRAKAQAFYAHLSKIDIMTGDPALDSLLKWLPYQVLCSRFYGKTGFYQAGGAYGFRDQLQDALALLYVDPQLVRAHILESAKHQFLDGDVQHWWHPPAIGVRTKITDDRLFLPLAVAEYIAFTGKFEILAERVPFLHPINIPKGSHNAYASACFTERSGSILEHCMKAIQSSFRFGENGLMLMGGGDWNDAMDKIGAGGKGTTVWGSMFLFYVIGRFLPYVNDPSDRSQFLSVREQLREAVDAAWDGEWFARAYTDEGAVVGSIKSDECKIDLLTQSWAQISGISDDEKIELALYSAGKRLIDQASGSIRLLAPPFQKTKGIGYIADYPCGVRENGGQYTHAAVWYIISLLQRGKNKVAYDLIQMINPVHHAKTLNDAQTYAVEPYVLAADVYSGEYAGKGGWSWYTGAAAWFYKCIVENLFGISIKKNTVQILPNLPDDVPTVALRFRCAFGDISVTIDNTQTVKGAFKWQIFVDQIQYNADSILLTENMLNKKIVVKKVKTSSVK